MCRVLRAFLVIGQIDDQILRKQTLNKACMPSSVSLTAIAPVGVGPVIATFEKRRNWFAPSCRG